MRRRAALVAFCLAGGSALGACGFASDVIETADASSIHFLASR